MPRFNLQNATIKMRDGLAGTATVDNAAGIADGATTADITGVALNNEFTDVVPVGARFTVAGEALPAGETEPIVHVVTATDGVTDGATPSTNITFSPGIEAGSAIADGASITVLPQELEVRIGTGNLTYTEARNLEYELDRGRLDSVVEGDETPVAVTLAYVYEFVRTGTNEVISPVDAVKGINAASGWVSAGSDPCEPYAVDLIVCYEVPCSTVAVQTEVTTLREFRFDQLQYDLSAAQISVTGRSNRTEAVQERI